MLPNIELKVLSWLAWRQAVEYLKYDKEKIIAMPLKLNIGYGMMLGHLAEDVYTYAQTAYKELRKAGISILGVQFDKGEHFVLWKKLGETKMLRIHDNVLRKEAQKKVDELTGEIADYWKKARQK